LPAAASAGLDVDGEHAPQALHRGHLDVLGSLWFGGFALGRGATPAACRRDGAAQRARRGKPRHSVAGMAAPKIAAALPAVFAAITAT
jgi:hypothetical protein